MPTPAPTPRPRGMRRPSLRSRRSAPARGSPAIRWPVVPSAGAEPVAPVPGEPVAAAAPPVGSEAWVVVARLGKVVGLQGLVRLHPWTDHPERFRRGARLFLRRPSQSGPPREVRLDEVRVSADGGMVTIRLAGIATPEEARELTGAELVIPVAERVPPPPGAYYPDELVGLTVLSPAGDPVGRVTDFDPDVPSPYLTIHSECLGEVLVPFRKVFIGEISREERTLRLCEPLEIHVPR